MPIESTSRFCKGHSRRIHPPEFYTSQSCKCGCGGMATPGKRFRDGHWIRLNNPTNDPKVRAKMSKSRKRLLKLHPEIMINLHKSQTGDKSSSKRPEMREKLRAITTKLWQNPEYRKKHMGNNNPAKRLEVRKKISENNPMKNPVSREKIRKKLKGRKNFWLEGDRSPSKRPDVRKKMSKSRKELYKNPVYQKTYATAMCKSPNIPEKELMKFFKKEKLPFKYTGDFSFWINGRNPDFVNINGEKKLIEHFGTYWHGEERTGRSREEEERRCVDHYKKYGWKTLIIWEDEMKDLEKVKQRLISFDKERFK